MFLINSIINTKYTLQFSLVHHQFTFKISYQTSKNTYQTSIFKIITTIFNQLNLKITFKEFKTKLSSSITLLINYFQ